MAAKATRLRLKSQPAEIHRWMEHASLEEMNAFQWRASWGGTGKNFKFQEERADLRVRA